MFSGNDNSYLSQLEILASPARTRFLQYYCKQWSIIPLKGISKVPLEEGWTRWCEELRAFNMDEFLESNAGIATGPASNLLVLDVDHFELFESVCRRYGWVVPKTRMVMSGKGVHHYFSYPQDGRNYGLASKKTLGFDIRGNGGQVVAPFSIHPITKTPYKEINELPIVAPPEWMLKVLEEDNPDWRNLDVDKLRVSNETKQIIKEGLSKPHRSDPMMTVLVALAGAKYSDDQIYYIFYTYPIGEKFMETRNRDEWLMNQIRKARGYVVTNHDEKSNTQIELIDDAKLRENSEQFLSTSTTPVDTFDISCLPEKLRNYVESLSAQTDAEPIMLLSSVLAMTSAAMRNKCFIPKADPVQQSDGYFQELHPNLWILNLSQSGKFKTTALNYGLELAIEHDKPLRTQIKAKEKSLKNAHSKPDNSEEVEAIEKELNDYRQSLMLLPDRNTGEGLLTSLSQNYGGVIKSSEFGAWLTNMSKTYNKNLKELLTELYDVPEIYQDNGKTQGTISIVKPYISICGVSTLAWIKGNIAESDVSSGFFARFLIFYPPQHDKQIPDALPKYRKEINYSAKNLVKSVLEKISGSRIYELGGDARNQFEKFHHELYEDISKVSEREKELLSPYVKRWSPYALKLSMILQVFIDETNVISAEAFNGAAEIVRYASKSTKWVLENVIGESEHQRKCRTVLEYIANRKGKVEWQKLISSKILKGGTGEYEYVVKTLEESGAIRFNGDLRDKKSLTLVLNPAHDLD